MEIGTYIHIKRLEKGLTMKEFAQEIGISHPYMSMIEKGKRNASVEILGSIADYLEVNHSELLVMAGILKPVEHSTDTENDVIDLEELFKAKTVYFAKKPLEPEHQKIVLKFLYALTDGN